MAGKARAAPEATAAVEPLPAHVPLSTEVPAHIVERLTNEGTVIVRDQTTGGLSQLRLGVAEVSGVWTLVVVSDP